MCGQGGRVCVCVFVSVCVLYTLVHLSEQESSEGVQMYLQYLLVTSVSVCPSHE